MKTLKNYTLIYDEDCPLCRSYTERFIAKKMLDESGRKPFSKISEKEKILIHPEVSRNKIALINNRTGQVTYGLDSILKVLSPNYPMISRLVKLGWVKSVLLALYAFISYNRRIFMPVKTIDGKIQCSPTFNLKARLVLIFISTTLSWLALTLYSPLLDEFVAISSSGVELLVAFGQLIFMSFFTLGYKKNRWLDYLGNLSVVSLIGSLALIPIVLLDLFIEVDSLIALLWFNTCLTFMFLEHFRRIKILELSKLLSVAWIGYRLIILIVLI